LWNPTQRKVRVEWGTRPLLETREKWRTLGYE
jgi:hypothetical protein